MTRDEFFDDPNAYFYGPEVIPDEWIAEAWETDDEFRDNITYGIERYISKGFTTQTEEIQGLAHALPLQRMVEVYIRLRDSLPWYEPAFRPAFEQVFGEQMAAFPTPLSDAERERLWNEYGSEPPGDENRVDGIPF
jgi:hypothetical protein